jgi:predicted MPP superfamily phosphohydrolase
VKIAIFAILFLTVFALLNYYIVKRFVNKLHISDKYKKYFKIFLLINYIGVVGYFFARYNPELPNSLYFLISLPIGVIFLLFVIAIIYDISHTLLNKTNMETSRRDFFKKSLDIGAMGVAVGLTGRAIYEARHIVTETVDVKISNLNGNYNMVQLSDIHIGGLVDKNFIANLVQRVNALNPDIIVITGDMVDISLKYANDALDELLDLQAPLGKYFIVGNHEYFHGLEEIIQAVKKRNIRVLENESVYIGDKSNGFNLAGVYDVMGYRIEHHQPDLKKALSGIERSRPTILLAHQPRFIEEVDDTVDLMLSGHTHGGQIYPFRLLVRLVQPYLEGLYQHSKKTQVYVNRGTGFWGPPMRLGASSEITNLRIS